MSQSKRSIHGDLSIWDQYKKTNLAKPQNVSQLMKWSQQNDNVRSLRFFEAKKIFKLKSNIDANIPTDIAQEKLELKEWIQDCKEEIICIRSDELQNEDDYEESMEELEIKFGHLLNKLHETKQQLIKKRKQRYDKVQKSIQSQKKLLQQTLNILEKTLDECDIKRDKQLVHKTLSEIPEFTEIEYKKFEIDLLPLKKEITKLSRESAQKKLAQENNGDSKQLLEFKNFSEFKNDDDDEEEEEDETNIEQQEIYQHGENNNSQSIQLFAEDDTKENSIISNGNSNTIISNGSTPQMDPFSPTNLSAAISSDLALKIHLKAPSLGSITSTDSINNLSNPVTPNTTKPIKKKKKKMKRKDFQFISVIGRGTFGKIVLVKKKDNDKKYAMKVLKKTQIIAQQQEDNINTEIKVLKTIKHPFLLRAHYVFQTESKIYLVLDYYRYGDLMSHLKLKKKFTDCEAKHIISEVALSIGCLHGGGIVYRDLKPENILMDAAGHICLCDFGLCKKVGINESMNTFCGTPDYLAPEILNRKSYNKDVDWWSFGILLFELIVGIVPFYSSSNMQMYEKIKTQQLMFPSYFSGKCQDLIKKLLERDPKKRLGSINDIADIRKHEWFDDIDWIKLLNKEIEPPYRPGMHKRNDSSSTDDDYYTDYDNDQIESNMELTPTPNLDKGLLVNYAI